MFAYMVSYEQFLIRIIEKKDSADFYELVKKNTERLEDFFAGTVEKTKTLEETKAFIDEILQKHSEKTYYPYVIVDTTTKKLIGFVDFKNLDWRIPKAEIGCFIDQYYTDQGIASHAMKQLMAYYFDKLNFKKLFLRTHESNRAAIRLAESCGFDLEGIVRRDYKTTSGELLDLIYYGKLQK